MQIINPRRMGVELEYNSMDKLSRSVSTNNLPYGIYIFSDICLTVLKKYVEINKWHNTNNNENWVVKPDASCGLEICSPPQSLNLLINDLYLLVKEISKHSFIESDLRCSFHVHVEIQDFEYYDLVLLVETWIRCEPLFFFLCEEGRWMNNYCKALSLSFASNALDSEYTKDIINAISENKYYAINLCNYKKKKKTTVEFRIIGSNACKDAETAVVWCKILSRLVSYVKEKRNRLNRISEFDYFTLIDLIFCLKLNEDKQIIDWMKKKYLIAYNKFTKKEIHFENIIWEKLFEIYQKEIYKFIGEKA